MPTFYVKSRRTSPLLYATVESDTREGAIQQVVKSVPDNEEVQILQVQDIPYPEAPAAAKKEHKEK